MPITSAFPSPDGRFVAGDQLRETSGGTAAVATGSCPAVLVAEAATGTPHFRVRAAYANFGDRLRGTRWLADSSGVVAMLGEGGDPHGASYGVVGANGKLGERLPRPPLLDDGPWHRRAAILGPLPSPSDPALFSFGRTALLDAATGLWAQAEVSAASGPDHLEPWGAANEEMVFALPHEEHYRDPVPALEGEATVEYEPLGA